MNLATALMPSHSGPWRSRPVGEDTVHCYPLFGPKHRMHVRCWCHPMLEMFEDGTMVLHNVWQ